MTHPLPPAIPRGSEDIAPPAPDTPLADMLAWVVDVADRMPLPGAGATDRLWRMLGEVAAADIEAARILEPHLDARAILAEAEADGVDTAGIRAAVGADATSTWGVFAAEGSDMRLEARRDAAGRWTLHGTKPWCSLAGSLSHALVTAWTSEETRGLFALDLRGDAVCPRTGPWAARGLPRVVSAPVDVDGAPAVPVGDEGWYLRRPGFRWGGMGVAAIWHGGAAPLVAALAQAASGERADQLAQMYAGRADAVHWAAGLALASAAAEVDAGVGGDAARRLAERVRAVVAGAAEEVLALSGRALGPGPLTTDEAHARRVADLALYLRQHHGERDLARLGAMGGSR